MQSVFIAVRAAFVWRRKFRRMGSSVQVLHAKAIRRAVSLNHCSLRFGAEKKARAIFLEVLEQYRVRMNMIGRLVRQTKYLESIQQQFLFRAEADEAKIEVLTSYWNKLTDKLLLAAIRAEDVAVKELCSDIKKIKDNVRHYLLSYYLRKCRDLHSISFLQWRDLHPPQPQKRGYEAIKFDKENITKLINDRRELLYFINEEKDPDKEKILVNRLKNMKKAGLPTTSAAELPATFFEDYGDIISNKRTVFNIYCFEQLALCDPFEDEVKLPKFKMSKGASDLVYDKSRYNKENSPHMIYIPNSLMMFKLMRSTLEVVSPQDLWFNLREEGVF